MVDRLTLTASKQLISEQYGVEIDFDIDPRFNCAPTQDLPVITQSHAGQFHRFKWGLMSNWSNNKKMSPKLFNLPIDSALGRPSYRKSLSTRRCIIPASGFYLWKPIAKKKSTPYYFSILDNQLLSFAGIWEENDEFEENTNPSFMLVTAPSSPQVGAYQDDMPLILNDEMQKIWLNSSDSLEEITRLLQNISYPEFSIHPVSPLISNIKLDSEELIKASRPSDQFGNYTLFN